MPEDIDANQIVAEFLQRNFESFFSFGKGLLKGAAVKVRLRLRKSYENYLNCVTGRYSKSKSFFIRDEPTFLYNFYVPLGLDDLVEDASIEKLAAAARFVVIAGLGGSGKSMMMRHLFLDALYKTDKVPVFLELRELNRKEISLTELIVDTLHSNHFTLDADYIEKAMKQGHFLFLLDGYDEIDESLRGDVQAQIQKLVKNFDKNFFIVSSRPDREFAGWQPFSVFSISSLNLEKACALVDKVPYDSKIKEDFIRDLRNGLFEEHKSFLSNPLLLSIMLLTYGENAEIPNKLSIFYSQAYEALFQRHDALKGGYLRQRSSGLDIQDFAKVFAAFSLQTYDKRVFSLSRLDALENLENVKKLLSMGFDSENYLRDAQQSVCLLVEEGQSLTFSHRSFQEYFVARFIRDAAPDLQKKLIGRYAKYVFKDSVFDLLFEMSPELVERALIIPQLEKLEKLVGVKNKVGLSHYLKFLKALYVLFDVSADRAGAFIKSGSAAHIVYFALKHTGHLIGYPGKYIPTKKASFKRFLPEGAESVEFVTNDLSLNDDFLKYLATSGRFHSIFRFQAVVDLKKALIKKHEQAEESIEEMLSL